MAKMGRPPVPEKDQRTERITVPLNQAELDQINASVKSSGLPAATYCRMIILKTTEQKGKK
jgi:predicted DNA binding CopG/RHH family protein